MEILQEKERTREIPQDNGITFVITISQAKRKFRRELKENYPRTGGATEQGIVGNEVWGHVRTLTPL